jgi:signal transduction histidine kinase
VKPTFGLRTALIVLVMIAIVPVFALVVKSSVSEERARLERAQSNLRSVVNLAAAHQERIVGGAREVLAAIASSPALTGRDWSECAAYMQRLQASWPVSYGTFGVLDAKGDLACRAQVPAKAVNSADRHFFRTAVATGRFSVGEHVVSRTTGKSVLPFGWPVYGASDGTLRGVAYLALDLDRSAAHLRQVALPGDIELIVTDYTGTVLASSGARPMRIGERLPQGFLLSAVGGNRAGSGRATAADGSQWLYQVQPVGRPDEGLLYVAGVMPMSDVLAPAAQRLREQLLALAAIAAAAAAIAWALGDRILVRPVRRLLERVDALAREEADLRTPARPSALHELRDLEQRFHGMARSLVERSVQRDGALAEIAGQNRLLESMFESMAEGVLVLDAKGRFLHLNAAALRIMPGLAELRREKDPLGVDPKAWGLFDLDGRPLESGERPVARVLRGENLDGFRCVLRGRLSGGPEKIIQGRARELITDGRRYGAVVVFSDITAEYRAEQELRRLNETLERRVAERTEQLALSNRELESFSYSVSHDLRAPLQVIDGFGRALMTKHLAQLDDRARHYLQRISDNTRQMGQLIDDLLSLARVTRTPLRHEVADLAPRARRIVEQLRQREPDRVVTVEIDETIPCVGDPGLLTILLDNLIGNAWKFTSHRPCARICVGSSETPEGERVYHVSDDGAGFDTAYASKLFNPFQRLHAASEFPGTGIGLATVQRIVARHGGRVWADARPQCGATFRFTLKGVHDEQQDPPGRGQPGSPGADPHDARREQCAQ